MPPGSDQVLILSNPSYYYYYEFNPSLTSEPFLFLFLGGFVQWSGPEPVAGWRFWTCCQFLKFTVCLPACLIYNWRFYSPRFHILHVRSFSFLLSIVSPTCFIPSVGPAGGLSCFNGPLNEILPLGLQTETEDIFVPYVCVLCCECRRVCVVCVCVLCVVCAQQEDFSRLNESIFLFVFLLHPLSRRDEILYFLFSVFLPSVLVCGSMRTFPFSFRCFCFWSRSWRRSVASSVTQTAEMKNIKFASLGGF